MNHRAEFDAGLRWYCRNPRCRLKLRQPVSNPREAFCCRGCHTSFYLHRCLVCEEPIERKREDQRVCRKPKCRRAWRVGNGFGRYVRAVPPSAAKLASKTPDFIGSKQALDSDRAWCIVAGPELTAAQLSGATIPDGPNGRWQGGAYQRVEARSKALLRDHFAAQAAKCLIQPHQHPVNIAGGYRLPGTPALSLKAPATPKPRAAAIVPNSLEIPEFLRRSIRLPPGK